MRLLDLKSYEDVLTKCMKKTLGVKIQKSGLSSFLVVGGSSSLKEFISNVSSVNKYYGATFEYLVDDGMPFLTNKNLRSIFLVGLLDGKIVWCDAPMEFELGVSFTEAFSRVLGACDDLQCFKPSIIIDEVITGNTRYFHHLAIAFPNEGYLNYVIGLWYSTVGLDCFITPYKKVGYNYISEVYLT